MIGPLDSEQGGAIGIDEQNEQASRNTSLLKAIGFTPCLLPGNSMRMMELSILFTL